MTPAEEHELTMLYHTARIAGKEGHYDRACWAAREFARKYHLTNVTAIYKNVLRAIGPRPPCSNQED